MMRYNNAKSVIKQNWIFYLIGFAVVFGIKIFYSRAGSDELKWILTPTAWWVSILSGFSFTYKPDVGYINHSIRFIIAASCSGVQFMVIAAAALLFSFVHRMKTIKRGFGWVLSSLVCSYLCTIIVNGIRIVLAIMIPAFLQGTDITGGMITAERLHTIIGIVVYFISLLMICRLADCASRKLSQISENGLARICVQNSIRPDLPILRSFLPPVFWYFSIALGIPFFNRAYVNNQRKFTEYAALMAAVCFLIISLCCLTAAVNHFVKKRIKSEHSHSLWRRKCEALSHRTNNKE